MTRGQANLPALAVALLLVTTTAGVSFGIADGAFASGTRDAETRYVATALAERLVAADSPLTSRSNVVNATALENLTGDNLDEQFPVVTGRPVTLSLDDQTVVARGDDGGVTVQRIVLVERRQAVTRAVTVRNGETTLPRRTDRVRLRLDPPQGTTVTTVRANGRVVLHRPGGLAGAFEIRTSRFETTRLRFTANGPLGAESVHVTYYPAETRKAMLVVTVS